MELRAKARGNEYVPPRPPPPPPLCDDKEKPTDENGSAPKKKTSSSTKLDKRTQVALKLKQELDAINTDESLRAKERRSNKRKAEAIAAEAAGCSVEEMQKWYEENQEKLAELEQKTSKQSKKKEEQQQETKPAPLIVFVGQLSYATTREGLFQHIKKELSDEHKVTEETVKVRLLTDPKTKKSRGMAFVELANPELMYACLKLHKSLIEGRRINVEKSAGGRNKESRQSKIKQFREKQEEYLSSVVDNILADYIKSGELKEGELDEGAIALCKRHTAAMVEAALKEYIENNGRTMDNTSAYFSFLLGKLAEDKEQGVFKPGEDKGKRERNQKPTGFPPKKKAKTVASKSSMNGVDFSLSEEQCDANSNPLSKIFPSMARGRGRGRGYM